MTLTTCVRNPPRPSAPNPERNPLARRATDSDHARKKTQSPTLALASALFLSGASALTYQIVWQRVLAQETGVDAVSVAVIVGVFIFGWGIGSLCGARIVDRGQRTAMIQWFILAEILIGLFGMQAVPFLRSINALTGAVLPSGPLFTHLLNAAALAAPTILMGLTTPLAIELLADKSRQAGNRAGLLCGFNTLGAAAGALVAGFALIEWLGLTASSVVASLGNFAAAAIVAWRLRSALRVATSDNELRFADDVFPQPLVTEFRSAAAPPQAQSRPGAIPVSASAACALLGFTSLAMEIVMFRRLAYTFESHVYIFPMMLATLLFMMAFGDLLAATAIRRSNAQATSLLPICAALTAASLVAACHVPFEWMQQATASHWRQAAIFTPICVAPFLFHGAMFPLVVSHLSKPGRAPGAVGGRVLAAYTGGNVCGAVLAAFVLPMTIGSGGTLRVCIVATVVATVILLRRPALSLRRTTILVLATALAPLAPLDLIARTRPADEVRETIQGVVTYRDGDPIAGIQVNGTPASEVHRRPSETVRDRSSLRHLQNADPSFAPRDLLIVGIGPGTLIRAAVEEPRTQRIVVVELSPDVIDLVRSHSDPTIAATLQDPRVRFVIGDGRRFIRDAMRSGDRFDLIQVGAFFPDVSGSANIYSVDLMNQIRGILKPNGYFMTLDCTGIVRAALESFPRGFLIVGQPHYAFFPRNEKSPMHSPNSATLTPPRLREIRPETLTAWPINNDDRPRLEFRFLSQLCGTSINARTRMYKWPDDLFRIHDAAGFLQQDSPTTDKANDP